MKKHISVTTAGRPSGPAPEVLNNEACAFYLGVLPRTLRDLRNRGLPHLRVTQKIIRYRKSDIDAWLDSHRVAIVR